MTRQQQLQQLRNQAEFDVVILGGGINGACLFAKLCQKGYRVLLVDKADFASGTSQASGMMIWGGLLYLRNLEFASVFQLSADRDKILRDKKSGVTPITLRYLPSPGGRSKLWMQCGLWFYYLMGLGRRRVPRSESEFAEREMLKPGLVKSSLTYEEGSVDQSDARFVYQWLSARDGIDQIALNYCAVSGDFDTASQRWQLNLRDTISGENFAIKSAMVVNCAGIWTDEVNAQFNVTTPFRHVLSKGVYLGLPRSAAHQSTLVFDSGEYGDVLTHVPWGPISLWGPTETTVDNIADNLAPTQEDIAYLLAHYARRYSMPMEREDIISVRCGIRPLVVDANYQGTEYPLDLSRRQEVVRDADRPWISCYGGKLTGCERMANSVCQLIKKSILPKSNRALPNVSNAPPARSAPATQYTTFPGLTTPVVSATWSAAHELCCNLEDYLRRRTNIAQWIPRGGLGENDCNAQALQAIALDIAQGDAALAAQLFERYRATINKQFDALMQAEGAADYRN